MRIDLTGDERNLDQAKWYRKEHTLAWRAFGKALGIHVHDPIMVMDGPGWDYEPITKRSFYLEEAKGEHYLRLGHVGCWDEGAMWSLSPSCTYISYSADPDLFFVEFHGWHRPKKKSQIMPLVVGASPFMKKDELSSMRVLIGNMKRRIAQVGVG